tara:strand:- start:1795 stop:2805 length:1011 start_codon:yes stop_codon:yes gene_type:complete
MNLKTLAVNFFRLIWQTKMNLVSGSAFIVCGNYLSAIFFNVIQVIYEQKNISSDVFNLTITSFAPSGMIILIGLAFFIEAWIAGWDQSAMVRAFGPSSPTRRTDWFYTLLYASNISFMLGLLFTLGIGYYIAAEIKALFPFRMLEDSSPVLGFFALLFSNSLIFYIFHRFIHTSFLWDLHKSHHSAKEMNIITNYRSHPLELGLRNVLYTVPAALLGVSPSVVICFMAVTGFIVLMQHSEIDWNLPFVEKYLLIGAAGHRIHHSKDPKHYKKNLGYLVLWDRLFGTFHYEENVRVSVGIEKSEGTIYNSGQIKTELWNIYVQTCQTFFRNCIKRIT